MKFTTTLVVLAAAVATAAPHHEGGDNRVRKYGHDDSADRAEYRSTARSCGTKRCDKVADYDDDYDHDDEHDDDDWKYGGSKKHSGGYKSHEDDDYYGKDGHKKWGKGGKKTDDYDEDKHYGSDDYDDEWYNSKGPFIFTSTYRVHATPDQVVDMNNTFTGGLAGAEGWFNFGINSYENLICWNITLQGFRGNYSSPALTATHIHQADEGMSGPPRIAFPNPIDVGNGRRNSIGCTRGPFVTGVIRDGADTGLGFTVNEIEDDPSNFFADTHSSLAVPGAVRGQLSHGRY